jgi:hypothetical protein
MGITVKKFRIILWLILAIFVLWLFWQAVVPTGHISYTYDFRQENYFIKPLTPKDRVREPQAGEQKITGNPIYFALRTPRTFDSAKVTVSFKNSDKLPLIEAGVLSDNKVWRYRTEPLENLALDRLIERWPAVREGGMVLLQRTRKFSSIDDFLAQRPPASEITFYNYEAPLDFKLNGYQASDATTTIDTPIRGTFQLYTYINDEALAFVLTVRDLNQNKTADPAVLKLYQGQTIVAKSDLADDGVAYDSGAASAPRPISISASGLARGVYKLELTANDDLVTEKIETRQNKLAFINRLWLSDAAEAPPKLYTDSLKIIGQTINPGSLQKIKVGGNVLSLDETYRQFVIENQAGLVGVAPEKSDVIISGDSLFSFSKNQFFNPEPQKFSSRLDLDKRGVNYVLAGYRQPVETGGRKTASAKFDLKNAYREFYKYNFIISIPDLSAEDRIMDSLAIYEIRVDLIGTSLWQKLKKIIRRY